MSTAAATEKAPPDALEYAESLYDYAVRRLDPFSLRCWIIRRLMLDRGLAHLAAEEVFDLVLAAATDVGNRDVRRLVRDRRHQSSWKLRSTARDGTGRRHFHRPADHARA